MLRALSRMPPQAAREGATDCCSAPPPPPPASIINARIQPRPVMCSRLSVSWLPNVAGGCRLTIFSPFFFRPSCQEARGVSPIEGRPTWRRWRYRVARQIGGTHAGEANGPIGLRSLRANYLRDALASLAKQTFRTKRRPLDNARQQTRRLRAARRSRPRITYNATVTSRQLQLRTRVRILHDALLRVDRPTT